jgi:hypothetical protein
VLILPPGHAQTIRVPRRFSVRERWIIGSVLAVVAALVVAVLISIGSSGHKTAIGCVDVKFPIAIGGQELCECGARAAELCASAGPSVGLSAVEDRAVAAECRKAGLKVGQ